MGSAGAGVVLLGPSVRWTNAAFTPDGRALDLFAALVSPVTLRISLIQAGMEGPDPVPLDGALLESGWAPEATVSLPASQRLPLGSSALVIERDPLRVGVINEDGAAVQAFEIDPETGGVLFSIGESPLLGMGQGGPQFDRRGAAHSMRSGQGGYKLHTHGGVVPIQWLVSTEGWGLYIHQPLGTFDLQGERGRFDPPEGSPGFPLDIFLVVSDDPVEILEEWARLTGKPEMPPLWAFGYQQSHRTLAGPEEIRGVARTFREEGLPCDTLIYLGTGFTPSGWNTDNGEFSWNPSNFPDPEGMLAELHSQNFKVVVHVVLEGERLTGTVDDPCPDPPGPGATGSGREWPDHQEVACYWPIHRKVLEQGVDGWWPDQGDGLDAESRLARIRMYWDGMEMWKPDQRPFALHRNGYAGMARYAPFLWSGDVYSTWETLRTHVPVAVNTGLSGIPYWGTDIGGFVPTPEYTGELHVRWFQFGAFCPLFRAHGRTWHLRLPWGWNTGELGPDEVGDYRAGAGNPDPSELNNPLVEPILKKYLELRYRLLPYLYTAVRETHDTGLPIMRALWIHYPDDPEAARRGGEYLWGRDILVAPVVEQGATERVLYLPPGRWYDFWTEEGVAGGREIRRPVDLETIPLYVRAGAVLPMGPVRQYTSEEVDGPLDLLIFPGANGQSSLYEDDGLTKGYRRGEWMKILLDWDDYDRRLTLRLAEGSRRWETLPRRIVVRIASESATREVSFDGNPLGVHL